jgi:hypothetical protein
VAIGTDTKIDWTNIFVKYLYGTPLKSLSYEGTGDPSLPKFGTLRNYASQHGWKACLQARRQQEAQELNDAKLHALAKNPPSSEQGDAKSDILSGSDDVNPSPTQSESSPSKHPDMWQQAAEERKGLAEFNRQRIEAAEARRLERQAARRVDSFGRRLF